MGTIHYHSQCTEKKLFNATVHFNEVKSRFLTVFGFKCILLTANEKNYYYIVSFVFALHGVECAFVHTSFWILFFLFTTEFGPLVILADQHEIFVCELWIKSLYLLVVIFFDIFFTFFMNIHALIFLLVSVWWCKMYAQRWTAYGKNQLKQKEEKIYLPLLVVNILMITTCIEHVCTRALPLFNC